VLGSLYHVTSGSRLDAVLQEGLRVGSERHLTVEGTWANRVYGEQPIFLSRRPWLTETGDNVLLTVDARGLELVADLPSLVDAGAYLDEDGQGLWWEEGMTPDELLSFEDPSSAVVSYRDLLGAAAPSAISVTDSAACLTSIPSDRIQVAAWPEAQRMKAGARRAGG
jgi:hypothetical protein